MALGGLLASFEERTDVALDRDDRCLVNDEEEAAALLLGFFLANADGPGNASESESLPALGGVFLATDVDILFAAFL